MMVACLVDVRVGQGGSLCLAAHSIFSHTSAHTHTHTHTHTPFVPTTPTGNFNNARRLVRKLEERGVAGACLEDKLFPKARQGPKNEPGWAGVLVMFLPMNALLKFRVG